MHSDGHPGFELSGDQGPVFAFLSDPATHHLDGPVSRIDTHAAVVFLAGGDVYKVKRAIRFPFMDLSTLEKRRVACEAEVTINRRYTPDLYRGVVPVVRGRRGLQLGGRGEIVEWTVHLKRFDESRTLDLVAEREGLGREIVADLARLVLDSHEKAPVRDGRAATEALAGVVEETTASLVARGDVLSGELARQYADSLHAEFRRVRPLLLDRGSRGRVRHCHGDLHLRNIALIDGHPALFDAIEFDESIATTDVYYDLAFLLMDMVERGHPAAANRLLNRYLWASPRIAEDLEGLAALPFFMSLRAAVRAKVEALRFESAGEAEPVARSARRYLDAALAFLAPSPPRLVGVGGLSGTGKTSLAAAIAPFLGRPPGAVHLRSDIERKRLMKVGEYDRLPDSAYTPAITAQVFAALRAEAAIALRAGQSVVVDAVHRYPAERAALEAVAAAGGAAFTGLWLAATVDKLIERVDARHRDASDATAEIVRLQAAMPAEPVAWRELDAMIETPELATVALAACGVGPAA